MRVLVVEDDMAMRNLLVKVFTLEGFSAVGVSGGAEAMAILAGGHFDLLLSDIRMGSVDGWALASRAKALVPPIKVLLITAYGEPDDERRARGAGIDGYMSKPFPLSDLLATVRALVGGGS